VELQTKAREVSLNTRKVVEQKVEVDKKLEQAEQEATEARQKLHAAQEAISQTEDATAKLRVQMAAACRCDHLLKHTFACGCFPGPVRVTDDFPFNSHQRSAIELQMIVTKNWPGAYWKKTQHEQFQEIHAGSSSCLMSLSLRGRHKKPRLADEKITCYSTLCN
jgi:hypothetical protein